MLTTRDGKPPLPVLKRSQLSVKYQRTNSVLSQGFHYDIRFQKAVKALASSRGTRAKTDRIDAELIARFLDLRPDAGRQLPHEKLRLLRALCTKRGQLVELSKHLLAQTKARKKNGTGDPFEGMDGELKALLGMQIADLEAKIEAAIAADPGMAYTARILRSICGVGPVTS
ncbi:IS110 family transposase [Profundibacter sp.]